MFANGAQRVGYKRFHTGRYACNPVPRDGRPATIQDGFPFQGAKNRSRWSTLYTEIPRALATGKLDLRPECHVIRVETDEKGLATGVTYIDGDGLEQFQRARIVAVAGNAIETPRLLLNSASSLFPDGLANSSDQVGRNYMRHLTASVYAIFDQPVRMYRGETMAGPHRGRGAQRPVARVRRRLLPAAAVARRAVSRRLRGSRRMGPRTSRRSWRATRTWPACGSSARTCRRRPTA